MIDEPLIQEILYNYYLQGYQLFPNIYIYPWESDLLVVSRAGYVTEIEIKISKKDFRADFKKAEKHQGLERGEREPSENELRMINHSIGGEYWKRGLNERGKYAVPRPNYFYYACPEGVIKPEELPKYAGLIIVNESFAVRFERTAPKLHKEKAKPDHYSKFLNSIHAKHWSLKRIARELSEELKKKETHE